MWTTNPFRVTHKLLIRNASPAVDDDVSNQQAASPEVMKVEEQDASWTSGRR